MICFQTLISLTIIVFFIRHSDADFSNKGITTNNIFVLTLKYGNYY